MLDLRIRITLDHFPYFKPGRSQALRHFIRAEEMKIERNRHAPHFVAMKDFVAQMEGEQEKPARLQDAMQLAQRPNEFIARNIYHGIKRRHAGEGVIRHLLQGKHIALGKLDPRIQAPGSDDHFGRKVDAADSGPALMQITGDLARTGANVANQTSLAHMRGKATQELAIDRLVPKLIVNLADICIRYLIVSFLDSCNVPVFHLTGLESSARWVTESVIPRSRL